MPRTLLLALIATAMTGCNRSGTAQTATKMADNIGKQPQNVERLGDGHIEQATSADTAVTH
jgi:hypothetical protein